MYIFAKYVYIGDRAIYIRTPPVYVLYIHIKQISTFKISQLL